VQFPLAPERPVDLFKAIFEADVDDEEESEDEAEDPAASTVTASEPSGGTGSIMHAASGTVQPAVPGERQT